MTVLRACITVWRLAVFAMLGVAPAVHADTVNTRERQVRELAPGIYRLAALDPLVVVPGHGEVLRGEGYIERVAALFRGIRQQINDLLEKNGGGFALDEVQKAIDLSAARREFAGDDADNREFFDASMASLTRTPARRAARALSAQRFGGGAACGALAAAPRPLVTGTRAA